ncbi:MAG: 2-succinyl-6-hydroxy-2,4-cyclohexadiene-1-carboxylate synthase [Chloroflexi bacterium]|nr:2-succinyl-6-hydroxy-2,4-cyclohexadiene-1-carboxylate synthase [Chloroflexota bacterium]
MTRIAVNGVQLNAVMRGEGPSLLLLHGFTGSSGTWTPYLDAWPGVKTIAVDLLGHGASDSPGDPERYRMERCVGDLVALLDRLGIERTAVLGYSMGGRVALHLALSASGGPERLWALVLESASPGIEDASEREERRRSDEALAERIEREGLERFVAYWEEQPVFASQSRLPDAVRAELRRQRLGNNPVGLANSLRGLGAGRQEPVLHQLGELRVPVLLIAGALDQKYCDLARRMAAVLPCAQMEIVPEAGHTVHLEQPEAFDRVVRAFLNTHTDCGSRR